jgi:predicted transcriptional regulator
MAEMATAIVTVRLDASVKAKLESLAQGAGRSASDLAASAIAAFIALEESQRAEIEAGIAELDDGEAISQQQAEALYDRLLKSR